MSLLSRRSRCLQAHLCSIHTPPTPLLPHGWRRALATGPPDILPGPDNLDRPRAPPRESPPPGQKHASGLKALRSKTKLSWLDRTILGQSADLPIRARFAPSPTGYLHLGSLRTALFNKLSATASRGGAFILRVEDTDQSRLVPDAEASLLKDLAWAGLSWDEGPDVGGPYGPYRQSERLPLYKKHAQELLDKSHAYRCFCTPELLEAQKRELHDAGKPTIYPGTCRSIGADESERRAAQGDPHVLRLKSDSFGRPKLWDAIYGAFQKKDAEEDFILLKTDGFPTYHFANVVDDHLMNITHEWLISTPKHLALYHAFGWTPPTFAHLGLLVNPDGTKLSKRHASASMAAYKQVFPMALLAWLANLGSSFKPHLPPPRTIQDLADALTFKFTRGGIKLNLAKLDHFNNKYRDALLSSPQPSLAEQGLIDHHLTQPTLRDIDRATTDGIPPWTPPLEVVPALADAETRSSYVRKTLSSGLQSQAILQHPYLYWRVPSDIYRASLAACPPDSRILDALDAALASPQLDWSDGDGSDVTAAVWSRLEPLGVELLDMYRALRLVGAGAPDVSSHSSSKMFALLGRDEWRYRLAVVRRMMEETGCT